MIGEVHFFNHVVVIYLGDMKRVDPGCMAQNSPTGRIQALYPLAVENHQSAIGVLIGVLLTMTMVMLTAMAIAR